jgi:hypothetical protein
LREVAAETAETAAKASAKTTAIAKIGAGIAGILMPALAGGPEIWAPRIVPGKAVTAAEARIGIVRRL